jgi:hypothetical protein
MALDTTKLRRRLPQPPTEGSPGMDAPETRAPVRTPTPVRQATPRKPRPRPALAENEAVPTDGRSLRATGRTTQLNLKVAPETKARFLALAQARNSLLVDLFEDAISALEAEDGIQTVDEDNEEEEDR